MVRSKADILRATSRHEARHAQPGSGSGSGRSGLSRFVPSKATVLKGALGAASVAAVAAGIHALGTYNPSYEPHRYSGIPAFRKPAATRVATDRKMKEEALWFEDLFGFGDGDGERGAARDPEFKGHREQFTYDKENGSLSLASDPKMKWQAGKFEATSLATLRRQTQTEGKLEPTTPSTITFVSGDVAVLHGDLDYAGAVFQAASQFNCLEFISPEDTPEHGVAAYYYDKTQGPACAISCAPGTIVRNYFAMGGTAKKSGAAQNRNVQINTLDDVNEDLRKRHKPRREGTSLVQVRNGYTSSTTHQLTKLNKIIASLTEHSRDTTQGLLRVGVQTETQVTCTKLKTGTDEPWHKVNAASGPLLVTQVYASALSVQYAVEKGDTTHADWAPFAKFVLEAAYEATLHAAVLYAKETKGRRKVVLTALGGGVFGNEPAWISAAIVRALKIFKNAGLDVVINEYTQGALHKIKRAIAADPETSPLLQSEGAFGREAKARPVVMYTE